MRAYFTSTENVKLNDKNFQLFTVDLKKIQISDKFSTLVHGHRDINNTETSKNNVPMAEV